MGKFGVNPREVVCVVGPQGYQQLKSIDEVTTVDKFGPQATILGKLPGACCSSRYSNHRF